MCPSPLVPADAAKRLVNEQQAWIDHTHDVVQRLTEAMERYLDEQRQQVDALSSQLRLLHPLTQLDRYLTHTQQFQTQLAGTMRYVLDGHQHRLEGLAGRLEALSPLAVLARGYSITFRLPGRQVIRDASTVRPGDLLETTLAVGKVVSTVTETAAEALEERA